MSHERYLSTDLHFLIAVVVWGESLNDFENFKKLCWTAEFFHKKSRMKIYFLMDLSSVILAWVQS